MKKTLAAILMTAVLVAGASSASARGGDYVPDEVRVTPYCGVYHFDRNKVRNGRTLNETPNCFGGSVGWDIGPYDRIEAGLMGLSFRNSIYKRTVVAGGYVETDLYKDRQRDGILDACGVGVAAGAQVVKGYSNTPVIGDVYGYCEKWRLRANVAVIPSFGPDIDSAVIWSLELKLWEG